MGQMCPILDEGGVKMLNAPTRYYMGYYDDSALRLYPSWQFVPITKAIKAYLRPQEECQHEALILQGCDVQMIGTIVFHTLVFQFHTKANLSHYQYAHHMKITLHLTNHRIYQNHTYFYLKTIKTITYFYLKMKFKHYMCFTALNPSTTRRKPPLHRTIGSCDRRLWTLAAAPVPAL